MLRERSCLGYHYAQTMQQRVEPAPAALSSKTKQLIAVARRSRDAVPLLHHRSYEGRAAGGSDAPGADVSRLGRHRNESRRRVRPFRANADRS